MDGSYDRKPTTGRVFVNYIIPIENFPSFWVKVDELVQAGRLVSPDEVLIETSKRSDELHTWLKARASMFRGLDEAVQVAAAEVLSKFPKLVGEKKLRTSADPFAIALARVEGLQIVTDEKPTGSLNRPHIPDVCSQLGMPTAMDLLQLIRAEKWIIG